MRDRKAEGADLTKRLTARKVLRAMAEGNYGVVTVAMAAEADIPAVEVRKLASRGALEALGQGVYLHKDVPQSLPETWLAAAVAMSGPGAFLTGTAVMTLLKVGDFARRPFDFMRNPVSVGTHRRIRRQLPCWIDLQRRPDLSEESVVWINKLPAAQPVDALRDVKWKVPARRWFELVREVGAMGHLKDPTPYEPDGLTDWSDEPMDAESPLSLDEEEHMQDRMRPRVVFVCSRNRGKSQLAAALMRHEAGSELEILSAGTSVTGGSEPQGSQENRDSRDGRDSRDDQDSRNGRNSRESWDSRDGRDGRDSLNEEAVRALEEIGVSVQGEYPKPLSEEAVAAADVVVVLGSEAQVPDRPGMRLERWLTPEPSDEGIEGMERMRIIRDEIHERVRALRAELRAKSS